MISISGSACLEATFHNKPSIIFADVSFSSLPSVHRIKSFEDLPQAIRVSLQKKVDLSELRKFIHFIDQNSFEFDMLDSLIEVDEFYNKLNAGTEEKGGNRDAAMAPDITGSFSLDYEGLSGISASWGVTFKNDYYRI